jgi:hypothetical protein
MVSRPDSTGQFPSRLSFSSHLAGRPRGPGFISDPNPSIGLLQDSKVIFGLNNAQFYAFYVDLLTRPVPVKFRGPPYGFGR